MVSVSPVIQEEAGEAEEDDRRCDVLRLSDPSQRGLRFNLRADVRPR